MRFWFDEKDLPKGAVINRLNKRFIALEARSNGMDFHGNELFIMVVKPVRGEQK